MKFTYPETETPAPEVVAYIDKVGDLIMKDTRGGPTDKIVLSGGVTGGGAFSWTYDEWEPEYARKVFYKGDQITITF